MKPAAATPAAPVLITMGDPCGIGPELVVQALAQQPHWSRRCAVVGDVGVLQRAASLVAGAGAVRVLQNFSELALMPDGAVPVWPLPAAQALPTLPPWGRVSAAAGRASAAAVEQAVRLILQGQAAALVTAPIHKQAWHEAGLPWPGHTEMLQALAAQHLGRSPEQLPVRMMLSNRELRTVLVSIHVSLRDAIAAVTQASVLQTLELTQQHFCQRLGWRACRIAVAGLNPHAGEGGLFGREEIEHIAPAIAAARAQGIDAQGPFAPDTVFMRARRGEFDLVLAMTHDHGLIPVKYLGLEHGVNSTLGLPFVRTSPDHGTAFDLAGTGRADPSSLVAALEQAFAAVFPKRIAQD